MLMIYKLLPIWFLERIFFSRWLRVKRSDDEGIENHISEQARDYTSDFQEFELLMFQVFKNFTHDGRKWVLQKGSMWDERLVYAIDKKFFAVQYKIRMEGELSMEALYSYYVITSDENGYIEINCENEFFGAGPAYHHLHRVLVPLSLILRGKSQDDRVKEVAEFFHWMLDKFKPSVFSHS